MSRSSDDRAVQQFFEEGREFLKEARELMTELREQRAGPAPTPPSDPVLRHFRRYLPLYAIITAWVLMLALVPSVVRRGGEGGSITAGAAGAQAADYAGGLGASQTDDAAGALDAAGAVTADAGGTGAGTGSARSAAAGGSAGGAARTVGSGGAEVLVGGGVTKAGAECKPGVRQLTFSVYAAPCVARFDGENGGNTYRGVTKDTIKIAMRFTGDSGGPNAQAVEELRKAAGFADNATLKAVFLTFVDYFNKVFETYGRKVVVEDFQGQGNGTEEAQSKGQELACADATAIVDKGYLAAVRYPTIIESQPFSECAAQRKLVLPNAAPYFPEAFFKRWHPYVWGTVMECERIGHDVAEYIGKRLSGRNAKWAGTPAYQAAKRKFGMYIPDNDGYQKCGDIMEADLGRMYNDKFSHRVNYQLDVSRFPDQAAAAVVQYKAANISTLVLACDSFSVRFLTEAAENQAWRPEWMLIGVASTDTEQNGRVYNQNQVNGHMFGLSQAGDNGRIFGPDSEAARAYKLATGKDIPPGSAYQYFYAVDLFSKIQAAGPKLTPDSLAVGVRSLPPGGGATGAFGTWSYGTDHTAIDDAREVFWVGGATGWDGKAGAFVVTYGGRRFQSGEWPAGEPPVYPK